MREPLQFNKEWFQPGQILDFLPGLLPTDSNRLSPDFQQRKVQCRPLKEYLQSEVNSDLFLPQRICERYLPVMDIVSPDSTNSTCFTKSYGHYVEGTGSILKIASIDTKENDISNQKTSPAFHLRYFSCREIANLMGFPEKSFTFPPTTTIKQRYRLLGNSLNVHVVSKLIKLLLDSFEINEHL